MRTKLLFTLSLFTLLAITLAFGQTTRVIAKVPFAFIASGKTLPAGQYEFLAEGEVMRVVGASKGNAVIVPVLTRLGAGIHTSKQDSHVVFDEVAGVYTLSEIWLPGEDGWLLSATKGKHQHKTVDVPR
jgi:hypothetical protein